MTTGDFEPRPGEYGDAGAYPPRFTGRQQPGGLGVRFFARLIDGIIVHIFGFFRRSCSTCCRASGSPACSPAC